MNQKEIGRTLKDLREKKGLTRLELSSALEISPSAVAMYEAGERVPRDEIKIRIAKFYGTTVEKIFFAV